MNKNIYSKLNGALLASALLLFFSGQAYSQSITMPNSGTNTYPGGVALGTSVTFLDPGGAGNYGSNLTTTYTFCPQTPGDKICITFAAFNVNGLDNLNVYSGTTATGTPLNNNVGSNGTVLAGLSLLSTSADGCLTIKLTSSFLGGASGWSSTIT